MSQKVRLTVECSADERMYIKMLAAKKHMTISEFLLLPLKRLVPFTRRDQKRHREYSPNEETIEALKESRKGKLESYETLDDFWKAMGIDPNA